MLFVEQASFLNNQGVYFLLAGDCNKSISSLQNALAVMKQAAADIDCSPQDATARNSSFQTAEHPLKASSLLVPGLEQDSGFIYNVPFLLDERYETNDIEATLPLFSAILLFNLGLACHRQARQGKESSLRKASHLYRMSLQLIEGFAHESMATTVLAVAALNNKAQIHYELCEHSQSRTCRMFLSRILYDAKPMIFATIDAAILEGLILTSLMLDPPTAAQAA